MHQLTNRQNLTLTITKTFAEDERKIGTTPLIEMTIDTGDHPPTAKKSYTLVLKHYEG